MIENLFDQGSSKDSQDNSLALLETVPDQEMIELHKRTYHKTRDSQASALLKSAIGLKQA